MHALLGIIIVIGFLWKLCSQKGRGWLVSPIAVFLVGTSVRWGIGAVLVRALGNVYLPDFDWGQYQVTFDYMSESTRSWLIFTIAIVGTFVVSGYASRGNWYREIYIVDAIRDGQVRGILNRIVCWLGIYTAVATIAPFIIGSSDRGAGYEYWATQVFRPDAVLLVLARLKYVFFFLVGIAVRLKTLEKVHRSSLLWFVGILAVLGGWQGSRGEFMYPLLMMVIGWLIIGGSVRGAVKSLLCVSLVILVSVPVIAGFRDTREFNNTKQLNLFGRISGLVSLEEKPELVGRRYFTLGREIYACSDGYVYRAEKELAGKVGFDDIGWYRVVGQVVPAIFGGSKEKFDSAGIVQDLIGIQRIRSWYPCLYTPADLYRRGGIWVVVFGGIAYGLVLSMVTALWNNYVAKGFRSYSQLLVWALPVSLLQAPPAGTVLEVIWFVVWEIPKYIVVALIIGWCMSRFYDSKRLD